MKNIEVLKIKGEFAEREGPSQTYNENANLSVPVDIIDISDESIKEDAKVLSNSTLPQSNADDSTQPESIFDRLTPSPPLISVPKMAEKNDEASKLDLQSIFDRATPPSMHERTIETAEVTVTVKTIEIMEIDDDDDEQVEKEKKENKDSPMEVDEAPLTPPKIDTHSMPNSTQSKPLKDLSEMVDNLKSPKTDDSLASEDNLVIDEGKQQDAVPLKNLSEMVENLKSPKASDGNLVIDEGKEAEASVKGNCMNNQCGATSDIVIAPSFICSFYGQLKANKKYYICQKCYDSAVTEYEKYCNALVANQPLLQMCLPVS